MVRIAQCMRFSHIFSSLFHYSGHLCTIGACDHYAPTRKTLAVHTRTYPGLPENRKRQLSDEFREATSPPKKRKSSIYSF